MRFSLLAFTTLLLCTAASADITRVEGLDAPESAFYDANQRDESKSRVWVSSMGNSATAGPGGDALMKNGAGTISVLNVDGTLMEGEKGRNWFPGNGPGPKPPGLNAPKGLFVHLDRFLLVAEKDSIRVIEFVSQPSGLPVRGDSFSLPIAVDGKSARLLNDIVVVPTNTVFVTDTFGNKIYRITNLFQNHLPGKPPAAYARNNPRGVFIEEFVSGLHLLSPNGITFDGSRLWVVGSDTFTGYGNFTSPMRGTNGQELLAANPEKPMPRLHPSINPGMDLNGLAQRIASDRTQAEKITNDAADPYNPILIPDPDPRFKRDQRSIDPVNSFTRVHHAKLYTVDLETRAVTVLHDPDGGFDGIAYAGGGKFLVGDFGLGKILSVQLLDRRVPAVQDALVVEPAKVCKVPGFCSNPADFSINLNSHYIYVPNLSGNEVQTYKFE